MKYAVTSPMLDGCITLEYERETGMLVQATFDFAMKPDQAKWLATHFPTHVSLADKLSEVLKGTVTKYDSVPTFDEFWRKYDNKVGKIASLKAWKKRSDSERIIAVKNINKYKKTLKPYQDMLMPATYLNTERYMDYEKDEM